MLLVWPWTGTVGLQPQFFEDAVNQMRLGQVDCSIIMTLNVDTEEIGDISLDHQLQSCLLHVLNDSVQFLEISQVRIKSSVYRM